MLTRSWAGPLFILCAGASAQELVWEIQGQDPSQGPIALLGAPVSIGDVDGDGCHDVGIGVSGGIFAFNGAWIVSGRDGALLRVHVNAGAPLAGAGDFDGDGDDDYLSLSAGVAVPTLTVRDALEHRVLWQVQGALGTNFGVTCAGDLDLDGDGRPDVVVGAEREGPIPNVGWQGAVYAYRHDGSLLYHIAGLPGFESLGRSIARVGDTDGDGCDDFVVGAGYPPLFTGAAILFSGKTGQVLVTGWGTPPDDLGWDVTGCGDLDGDGVPDFAGSTNGSTSRGLVRAFSGATGQELFTLTSPFGRTQFGSFGASIEGGYDLDLDGVPDLVVAAGGEVVANSSITGALYVFSGRTRDVLHRVVSSPPGVGLAGIVGVLPPHPGNAFPLFFGAEGFRLPGSSWNIGRVLCFRGAPQGVSPYGLACAGTRPTSPRIGMRELHAPVLGQPPLGARIHLSDGEPGGAGLLLIGLSKTSFAGGRLPFPLGQVGFPGCLLYTSAELAVPAVLGTGGLAAGYGFVDLPVLLSFPGHIALHGQWIALGTGSAFPGGVTAGLSWRH